jgi:hypothetical protein
MARAEVAGVASRLLPEGVRPDAETIKKIEAAIDATTVNVPSGASYADEMNAKQKNEDDALKKLLDGDKPKPKAKAKAK